MPYLQLNGATQRPTLGQLIAQLYHFSQGSTLEAFHEQCLQSIQAHIKFSHASWWIEPLESERVFELLCSLKVDFDSQNCYQILSDFSKRPLQAGKAIFKTLSSSFNSPDTGCLLLAKFKADACKSTHLFLFEFHNQATLEVAQLGLETVIAHLVEAQNFLMLSHCKMQWTQQESVNAIVTSSGEIIDMQPGFLCLLQANGQQTKLCQLPFSLNEDFYIDRQLICKIDQVFDFYHIEAMQLTDVFARLTNKEKQICFYLRKALSNAQIANLLNVSPKTVENHLTNIYTKLNIPSKQALLISLFNQETNPAPL